MLGVCVGRQPIAVHRAALSSHDAARSQERNHVTKVTFLQASPLFQFDERGTPRSNRPYRENESFACLRSDLSSEQRLAVPSPVKTFLQRGHVKPGRPFFHPAGITQKLCQLAKGPDEMPLSFRFSEVRA